MNRVQPSNKLLFPNKTTNSLREVFFFINFLFETENGVKLRSRYLFVLAVIRLMAFMFVVMDSEGDFFSQSRRQSTSLTCIPWTAWSCKNYDQGDRKLSLFLENYVLFYSFKWFKRWMSISCSGDFRDFFGGWVGGLRNGGMCDVTYGLPLTQLMYLFIFIRHSISSLFKNIWF